MKPLALALALLTLAGCAKNIQTKEAVKEAVMAYLTARQEKTGINMSAMSVEVANVTFQADHAMATVAFNLKTGESGMQMNYELERAGNQWTVKGASIADAPGGAPPGALPPGHPPAGGAGLPPGHPPAGPQ